MVVKVHKRKTALRRWARKQIKPGGELPKLVLRKRKPKTVGVPRWT